MTKYILAGGADRKFDTYAQRLNTELHKTLTQPFKALSCFFAEPQDTWEDKFATRKAWFEQAFGSDARVILATPERFGEQVLNADIIYLHGGQNELLAAELFNFPDIADMFAGKIVIGSSAGAIWLSNKAWTCDARTVVNGSGITDCNTIVHFMSDEYGQDDPRGPIDWNAAKEELQLAIGPHGKVTLLPEGDFIVVEQ